MAPSPRQWPTEVTSASPALPSAISPAASATPVAACASIVWPTRSPVACDGGLRRDVLESRLLLVRDALDAGRAGQDHVGLGSELLRQGMERCLDAAGLAAGAVGGDARDRPQAAWRRARRHARGIRAPGSGARCRGSCRRPPPGAPRPADRASSRGSRPSRRSGARRDARHCRRRRRGRCRPGRRRCARWAMRIASTPLDSSPMKVREAPVTPWTMEMLPASRFESWARKRVGRRSPIRRSLRKTPGLSAFAQAGEDLRRRPHSRARRRRRRR